MQRRAREHLLRLKMLVNNKLLIFARRLPDHRMERKKLHSSEKNLYMTLAAVIRGVRYMGDYCRVREGKERILQGGVILEKRHPFARYL